MRIVYLSGAGQSKPKAPSEKELFRQQCVAKLAEQKIKDQLKARKLFAQELEEIENLRRKLQEIKSNRLNPKI